MSSIAHLTMSDTIDINEFAITLLGYYTKEEAKIYRQFPRSDVNKPFEIDFADFAKGMISYLN